MQTRNSRTRYSSIESLEARIAPATIFVTNLNDAGAGSLRQAILDANDPALHPGADLITFRGVAGGGGEIALVTGEMTITDSLTIRGPGASKFVIDAGDLSRIFKITDSTATVKTVSISGLSLVDGNSTPGDGGGTFSDGSGGGIFSAESLILSDVVISSCFAPGQGGGVAVITAGAVKIKNTIISGNRARLGDGGGLHLAADGGSSVADSIISDNTTGISRGGGLFVSVSSAGTGDIFINNTEITGNSAETGGGASLRNESKSADARAGNITVKNSVFSGNSASVLGGGLDIQGVQGVSGRAALIDHTRISENVASFLGRGLVVGQHGLLLKNSTINKNRTTTVVDGEGGGIFLNSASAIILKTVIAENVAVSDGGGFAAFSSTVLLQDSSVTGNTAAGDGGGVHAAVGSSLTVKNSSFFANRAASSGGALHTEGLAALATKLTIKDSAFRGNFAGSSGGAVDTEGDGIVLIAGTNFSTNTTGGDGGGLHLRSSSVVFITDGLIINNTAMGNGGGIAFGGSGTKSVVGTPLIRENRADGGAGGGIAVFGTGQLILSNAASVIFNRANTQGGGIANATGSPVLLHGAIVLSNSAPFAPQIFGPFTP